MKNLFKFSFILLFTLASFGISAQAIWLKTGLNMSKFSTASDEYNELTQFNQGFNLGLVLDFELSNSMYFETGIMFNNRGSKIEEDIVLDSMVVSTSSKANLIYVDIPLYAKMKFGKGTTRFFGLFGPYLGFGLDGRSKFTTSEPDIYPDIEANVNWGSDQNQDDLRRFDYGLTIGAGVEINVLQVSLTYMNGLANIAADRSPNTYAKNRVLSLNLGFRVGAIEKDSWEDDRKTRK